MLRDAGQLRATEQLPTPLEAGLLQQLPTAETVTPANWPEMLRAVGLLMRDLEVPLDGAALSAANTPLDSAAAVPSATRALSAATTPETPAPSAIAAAVRTLEGGGYGARDLAEPEPSPSP